MKFGKKNYWLYILPAILLIGTFVYVPIIQNFYFSLFKMNSYTDEKIFVGLAHYVRIFKDDVFYTSLKNNITYAIISVICQVGLGTMLAMLIESKLTGRLRNFYRNVLFMPSLISVTAVGLLWYFIYNPNVGMLNALLTKIGMENLTHAWLAEPNIAIYSIIAMSQWQYTGYIMVLILVAIQKIPAELFEAAEIDGANGIQRSLFVTIPNIKEMLLVTSVITVIGAFKLFTEIYVMTMGGPYNTTQVLGTYLYQSAFMFDEMGYASAIAVIIFMITFTASIIQIRMAKSGKG
ncbi:sugar ABC transporter permease [Gottschalkiaceae bacterium SANA]|nr:sugar ABC transporter permease [Gottschalkiaceae bacterium SANA]